MGVVKSSSLHRNGKLACTVVLWLCHSPSRGCLVISNREIDKPCQGGNASENGTSAVHVVFVSVRHGSNSLGLSLLLTYPTVDPDGCSISYGRVHVGSYIQTCLITRHAAFVDTEVFLQQRGLWANPYYPILLPNRSQ